MRKKYHQQTIIRHPDICRGLVFIPDISGFTELVHSTDIVSGKQIIYELLSAVISQNELNLNIAEVEGDAILFYRYGQAPSLFELVQQYELMVRAFEAKRDELQNEYPQVKALSLKVIAHYGPMTGYKIGKFKKLYGEVVVEAHRLLKNSIAGDSYLLLTDALVEITGMAGKDDLLKAGILSNKLCEVYSTVRNICFTYLGFRKEKCWGQVA